MHLVLQTFLHFQYNKVCFTGAFNRLPNETYDADNRKGSTFGGISNQETPRPKKKKNPLKSKRLAAGADIEWLCLHSISKNPGRCNQGRPHHQGRARPTEREREGRHPSRRIPRKRNDTGKETFAQHKILVVAVKRCPKWGERPTITRPGWSRLISTPVLALNSIPTPLKELRHSEGSNSSSRRRWRTGEIS